MADGAHTRQMALQEIYARLESAWTKTLSQGSWNSQIHIQEFNSSPSNTITVYPRPPIKPPDRACNDVEEVHQIQQVVKNPDPFVEPVKNSDILIEPLDCASVLQVLDSAPDVLMVLKVDSHVKEVEESSQQSTNGNDKIVAHQVFDVLPNEYQKDLTVNESSNKEVLSFSHKDDRVWEPGGVPNKMDLWDWPKGESKTTNKKIPLRHSCEEIYERMEKGFCIFCEDLDTPGHYNLKHKRSKLCLVEYVDDELPDAELVEPAVEEISNKSVNMIREKESSPENESRPEVLVSQLQVPLSSMEPSRRCRNVSLDVVDELMCNELVCEEDGDSIITMSTKFSQTYEDPRFELVSLEQSHDNSKSGLISSSIRHMPTYQYRAPFSPYQNYNDQPYYEREFGKCPEIEFDRESDEIKDEKLQDKQLEEDVKTLECVGDEPSDDEKPSEVTVEESIDKSVDMIQEDTSTPENESSLEVSPQILLSQLRIFDDESQGTFGDHTLAPMKPYQSYSQSWYELDTIHSDIHFTVLVAHECDVVSAVVVIYEVATTFEKLAKTWKFKFKSNPERSKLLDDMFSFMEKLSEKYVMVWESQQGNGLSLLNCLIDHDVLRPWICLGLYNSSLEAKLELSGWKYKKQINQGQICLNGLCNELVCDKEKKRESIEFNECHNHRKKLQAALEEIPQKITGGLIYGDVKFHLKHKWRSRLEFCVDNAIRFTSSVKLLLPKKHKLLHYEAEFCAQYNDLKQLSTEFQSFPGFSLMKNIESLKEHEQLEDAAKGIRSYESNTGHVEKSLTEFSVYGVFHLQRPPELGQTKQYGQEIYQVFCLSSLRTRMFRRGKYCDRIISNPGSHKPDFS